MIEFKADCGHTVRAKDEDAGKVVRCAYCGREVQMPEADADDDFDFFFADAGKDAPADGQGDKPPVEARKKKRAASAYRSPRTVDPFSVVIKMAYVAVILIIVIFVGKQYAWPFVNETFLADSDSQKKTVPVTDRTAVRARKPIKPKAPAKKYGLLKPPLGGRGKQGIYVNAVPGTVNVFYRMAEAESDDYQWLEDPTASRIRGPSYVQELRPGVYDLVVMLPVNDRQLKRPYAKFGYGDFRAKVERERSKEADRDAGEYFLPDAARAVKILRMGERINVARRYQVAIRTGEWHVLTPLFIPFAYPMREVAMMVRQGETSFGFDKDDIEDELAYYRVTGEDQKYIVDILERIGSISYHAVPGGADANDDYPFRMFKISPVDGIFTARYLEAPERRAFNPAKRR